MIFCGSCTVEDYREMKNYDLYENKFERIVGTAFSTIGILVVIAFFLIGKLLYDGEGIDIFLYVVGGFLGLFALYNLYDDVKHLIRIRKVMKEKNL
jgi:hypothetical protein